MMRRLVLVAVLKWRLTVTGLVQGEPVYLTQAGMCGPAWTNAWYRVLYQHGVLPDPVGMASSAGPNEG